MSITNSNHTTCIKLAATACVIMAAISGAAGDEKDVHAGPIGVGCCNPSLHVPYLMLDVPTLTPVPEEIEPVRVARGELSVNSDTQRFTVDGKRVEPVIDNAWLVVSGIDRPVTWTVNLMGDPAWMDFTELTEVPWLMIDPTMLAEAAFEDAMVSQTTTTPEPATMSLLAIGGYFALIHRRRKA